MSESFLYTTTVMPEWIDYNGHMRDAYYGLVFSHAVDSMQDEVGFDAAYRQRTGCTIYLLEDHKYYFKEVKVNAKLRVESTVLDSDDKRFHLQLVMYSDETIVAVCEFMELHVNQHPIPHAAAMPSEVAERLALARAVKPNERIKRSRMMKLR